VTSGARISSRRGRRWLGWIALAIAGTSAGVGGLLASSAADEPTPALRGSFGSVALVLPGGGGTRVPASFLGFSLEYDGLGRWEGLRDGPVDPVLVRLVRNLGGAVRGGPALRVGGNSTDVSWWNPTGARRPPGVRYDITRRWLRRTSSLLKATGSRVILGLNFAWHGLSLGSGWAEAAAAGLPHGSIQAFEVGNEPDLYGVVPLYQTHGSSQAGPARFNRYGRPRSYRFTRYLEEFSRFAERVRRAVPHARLAGPGFATSRWMSGVPRFVREQRARLGLLTYHRYPLRPCHLRPGAPQYPTIEHLLSDRSSRGLADQVAGYGELARRSELPFRVDEINSVSCGGTRGVGNSFASALWATDTLFELARVGAAGVNFHGRTHTFYSPFYFRRLQQSPRRWVAQVAPLYYGILLFAMATPNGASIHAVRTTISRNLKVWATVDRSRTLRVVLINKETYASSSVRLLIPGPHRSGHLERLLAASANAREGVTLAGQTFGPLTSTGRLVGRRSSQTIPGDHGTYTVPMPPASAALLTIRPGA